MSLEAHNLRFAYNNTFIIDGLSIELRAGSLTAIIGANGSGKSTLLKNLARLVRPSSGSVSLDGVPVLGQSTRQVAQKLAVLPQTPLAPDGLKVRELVSYGRHPWQNGLGLQTARDRELIELALERTNLSALADRSLGSLSGGQRQRAWIALALAQDSPWLLLDEPTTFLDVAHQLEVLQLLQELNRDAGKSIVMVVHDLNHASRYADQLIAMKDGAVVSTGSPAEVLSPDTVRLVFGIEANVLEDPATGAVVCVPVGLAG